MFLPSINNKFKFLVNKILGLSSVDKFILMAVKHKLNNETIGQSAEYSICINSNIKCYIDSTRINKIIVSRLNKLLKKDNILHQLPSPITESCGYKNGSVDFKLQNGKTLSLKTLRYKDGIVCPQKVGQPTLTSWDNIWKQEWMGELDKNPERWEFIKNNIHSYLNKMLQHTFCCDYLILFKNCLDKPEVLFYDRILLKEKLNYFTNQEIIYTREQYQERWNEKKQKYSEMSSTIKTVISGEIITIGEFQFHKSSRKELKFRFYAKFLETLF